MFIPKKDTVLLDPDDIELARLYLTDGISPNKVTQLLIDSGLSLLVAVKTVKHAETWIIQEQTA